MSISNKNYELTKQTLLATSLLSVASGVALALDQYYGKQEIASHPQSDVEFVATTNSYPDKTVVALGGLCMNTRELGQSINNQLPAGTNLICPVYPSKGFDAQAVINQTIERIQQVPSEKLIFTAWSMGGLIMLDMAKQLSDTDQTNVLDKIDTAVTWGTPFGKKAIKPLPKLALNAANSFLGDSLTVHHGRRLLNKFDLSLLREHPSMVRPQVEYLAAQHSQELPSHTKLVFIKNLVPDPIVDEGKSASIAQGITDNLQVVQDTNQHLATHAPIDRQAVETALRCSGVLAPNTPRTLLSLAA